MKAIPATRAKNLLGKVIDQGMQSLVTIERHGKPQVAVMPAEEARIGVLCAYATGHLTRARAMRILGYSWYGQLVDELQARGISVQVGSSSNEQMVREIEKLWS